MIDSLVLVYCPRFPTYLISLWGALAKKHPKISLKSYFLLLSKIVEITKLGNYKSSTRETWPTYFPPQHLSITKK